MDPVEIPVRDGLSGVVGPNGCGKSNLVEAIGWVMGENRPSVMRGSTMEDVIFSGAASRPAKSFAEVALELDNSDRDAPSAFNHSDRLEITRRITRDTGSTFRTNGKEVRWRDIQLLFADSASGARSSALVRQGQIGEIIKANPMGRAGILDDAAGVAGLQQRRHDAELKLKAAEDNLLRVQDTIEQIEGQLASLNRQVRQAKRYKDLANQLRQASSLLLYLQWKKADRAVAAAEKELRNLTLKSGRMEVAVSEASKRKGEIDELLPPSRAKVTDAAAALQRLKAEQDLIKEKEDRAAQALGMLEAEAMQLIASIERECCLRQDAVQMIAGLEKEIERLEEAASSHKARLHTAESDLADTETKLRAIEAEHSRRAEQVAALHSHHESARRAHRDARQSVADCESRVRATLQRAELGKRKCVDAKAAMENAEAEKTVAATNLEAAECDSTNSEQSRFAIQSELAVAKTALLEAETRLAALESERTELSKLLENETEGKSAILNKVSVTPGYESALGTAFGDDLFAAELEGTSGTGWVKLPPLESPPALPADTVPLSDFVSGPESLQRRLSQVGLAAVSEIDRLQPHLAPGQRLVSMEGDLVRWDGFRFPAEGGSKSAALRLARLNRLDQLEEEVNAAAQVVFETKVAHDDLVSRFEEISRSDHEARIRRRKADEAFTVAMGMQSKSEAALAIAARTLESLQESYARAQQDAVGAQKALVEAERQSADLPDLESLREKVSTIKTEVESKRTEMLDKRSIRDEVLREHSTRMARSNSIGIEIAKWKDRLCVADVQIAELEKRRVRCAQQRENSKGLPEQLAARKESLVVLIEAATRRQDEAVNALADAEAAFREASAKEKEALRAASDIREEKVRVEVVCETARSAEDSALSRIRGHAQKLPEELAATLDFDPDNLPSLANQEIEVNRLRRSRDALGEVNLRAEQDASEIQREMQRLAADGKEVSAAVQKLRGNIAVLNKEGKERILSAFESVNSNFQHLFKYLFGGGNARLELVESDDPLQTGIDILCHPPGKRFSTLSLLSGGEQTLTAIALIFAFFLANPSPVCVLDEVDAPLDDANVSRFCDLLEDISARTTTRFLVITHHSITMSRMHRLYGVTMREQGISQIVSVDLSEAERMVA